MSSPGDAPAIITQYVSWMESSIVELSFCGAFGFRKVTVNLYSAFFCKRKNALYKFIVTLQTKTARKQPTMLFIWYRI